jgi:hypothetical protein
MVQFCATNHRYDRSAGYDIEYQGIERDIRMITPSLKEGNERDDETWKERRKGTI